MCGVGTEKNQMGEADEGSFSSSGMTMNLSLQLDKYPRDLLQRFVSSTHQSNYTTPEETEELELNLGLSLAGQFGVDKNKLTRSSSIAGLIPLVCPQGEDSPTPPRGSYLPLMRTASLPTETEEEWRKRKELQMLRRMAAKKRRLEKQRSWNSKAEKEGGSGGGEEAGASRRACDAVAPPFKLPRWAQVALDSGDKDGVMGTGGGSSGVPELGPQTSQGFAESQGESLSGMLESDSRPKQDYALFDTQTFSVSDYIDNQLALTSTPSRNGQLQQSKKPGVLPAPAGSDKQQCTCRLLCYQEEREHGLGFENGYGDRIQETRACGEPRQGDWSKCNGRHAMCLHQGGRAQWEED